MTRNWLLFGLALIFFSACVPNKKLVYYQKDDLKHRKNIPRDTVLRKHTLNIQEYRIQPLDMVSVSFETLTDENDTFDFLGKLSPQTRMSGGVNSAQMGGILVDREGYIEYAVLGKIKLAGLTPFQAEDSIRAVASKYLPNVIVRLRLLNFRFTVLGEVSKEQTVVSQNTRLTISEALGLAGGLSELADRTLVKVIRQREGITEVYYINLLEEEFIESPHYYVQQNDVIVVPPLKQRTFRKYFTSNLAIITTAISFGLLILTLTR
ncbi:polysaccharide export outer membrane protein [Chryseolinea serpens]|uniref:Polysaccharide export outer membrane protein n=1 Tax=Chryseolinea serpens TaxID=947013 RepID=A0A1M5KZ95_9BACT|nr:polysaccharide biosynthesis/export family protein [Chryseolinea serpens]SHG58000.1 polysaccharide export outer membrane protein [Chryseolinea serpens]